MIQNIDLETIIYNWMEEDYTKEFEKDNSYFFCGGCAEFASALYHFLSSLGEDVQYISIADNCHDCVKWDNCYWDADGGFRTLADLMNNSSGNCDYSGAIAEMKLDKYHYDMIEETPCTISVHEIDHNIKVDDGDYIDSLNKFYKSHMKLTYDI